MPKLDSYDISILSALQSNGRSSLSDLSECANLSQTPCHARSKRLEQRKLIRGYRTEIDLGKVASIKSASVFVALNRHARIDFDKFEHLVKHSWEITECLALAGKLDYAMTVVIPKHDDFHRVMNDLKDNFSGIDSYFIHTIEKTIKRNVGVPVRKLLET